MTQSPTSPSFTQDPLLGIARVFLFLGLCVTGAAGICCAIAAPALLIFKGRIEAELIADKMPTEAFWAIIMLCVLAAVLMGLLFLFIRHLRRIVLTVGEGDPFVPINATRLASMAWLSLGAWVVGLPMQALGTWIEGVTEGGDIQVNVNNDIGISLSMVLVLFILARVFRKGADMREELEGTV